ncbi:MAG TPA: hypothetical protein VGH95_04455 [Candidatus Aquirickettsiella sp.]|jgi:hypothetical protein
MNQKNMSSPKLTNVLSDYSIPIFKIFIESYRQTKGIKKIFWSATFLIFIAVVVPITVLTCLSYLLDSLYPALHLKNIFYDIYHYFFYVVCEVSLSLIALQYIRGIAAGYEMALDIGKVWKPLVFFGLIPYFLSLIFDFYFKYISTFNFNGTVYGFEITVGFILFLILLIIISIYIVQLIIMTMLLVLDRNLKVIESLILSFKSINKHFFKNVSLGLFTWTMTIFLIVVTFGIGLIWLKPMMATTNAIQYQRIFRSLLNTD